MSARLEGRMGVEYEYDPHPKRGHRTRREPPLDGNGPTRSGEAAGQIPPPPRRQTALLRVQAASPHVHRFLGGMEGPLCLAARGRLPQWPGNPVGNGANGRCLSAHSSIARPRPTGRQPKVRVRPPDMRPPCTQICAQLAVWCGGSQSSRPAWRMGNMQPQAPICRRAQGRCCRSCRLQLRTS